MPPAMPLLLIIFLLTVAAVCYPAVAPVSIDVAAPAGPSPTAPAVETSVPFAKGELISSQGLAVLAPDAKPVLSQMRPGQLWPDGSIRWLIVVFEPAAGPGKYSLAPGQPAPGDDLVSVNEALTVISSGRTQFVIGNGPGLGQVASPEQQAPVTAEWPKPVDLVLTRADGKIFHVLPAQRKVTVEERGPVRATVRIDGQAAAEDGETLFDLLVRVSAYRDRPDLHLSVTWINTTANKGEKLRDIRLIVPTQFTPDRLVIGCERGVYDAPFVKEWPVFVLQEDHDQYWARIQNPDGRLQNLCSGGCNGKRAPGWGYFTGSNRALGVQVPNFFEEYPNELEFTNGQIGVGLWPERAAAHLLSKPILPSTPEDTVYQHKKYWPILPHPYLAFFDAASKCLDVPQGVAKTQEIVLSALSGQDCGLFEKAVWSKSLGAVRGTVDPVQVSRSLVCGPLTPRDPKKQPEAEEFFDLAFAWFGNHIREMDCYGKFDYGDFKYFNPATNYLTTPPSKWGAMGEMPREGYWHNNERDPFRGLLLYYLRSGDPQAWELTRAAARHALDVDIRHKPFTGMYTHSYGHCYAALGTGGSPDHAWLLGLLEWAGVSGDPTVWDWLMKCGDYLVKLTWDFSKADCRTAAMQLHMMTQFYRYTGEQRYLDSAKRCAEIFLNAQKSDGSWPAYLGNPSQPHGGGFPEHTIMALGDYYDLTKDERCLPALKKALAWAFPKDGAATVSMGSEVGLSLYGLAVVAEMAGEPQWRMLTEKAMKLMIAKQNRGDDLAARGDLWADTAVNNAEMAAKLGRPPQFLGQARPLGQGTALAYGLRALAVLEK